MDPNYSNPEALAVLSSTINQTLIETGRFFRSKGSMQSRAQLKRTMPASREQFNLALDDLSEQILTWAQFMAKAFLERDYEAVRARRATSQQPAEDAVMGETEVEIKPEQEAQAQPQQPSLAEPVKKEDEDRGEAVKREPEPKPISQDVKALPADDEKPGHPPAEIDLTTAPAPQEGQHQQHAGTVVPGAAEPSGIDFDSVLNDSAGGANDFDLDLDFGGDVGLGNQNFLGVGSGGGQEQEQGKGAGEEAMTTDAAGMEGNAASIGGDAFDMELQKAGAADPGMQGQQGGNNAEEMMPGPSSFDDLFMEHDSMGEGNLLEGDGLMNLNELDDSWFN